MRKLIIYTHPNKDGHNGFILKEVKTKFDELKIGYDLIDLYEENYDPVLRPNEHYTSGHTDVSEQTKKYINLIKQADELIFIYPVWWNSMPAMLKGFFDKILLPEFSYRFNKSGIPEKLLKGKTAKVFLTTGGPKAYSVMLQHRAQKLISKDMLEFCGIKTKVFQIGSAKKLTEKNKELIKKCVKRVF